MNTDPFDFSNEYNKLSERDSRNILRFHNYCSLEGIELDFTSDSIADKFGKGNWDYIDGCHDFVQWILPTKTPSRFNSNAPIVHQELLDYLKNNRTQVRFYFLNSLTELMYGMSWFFNEYFEKFSEQMPASDHNYLRITRYIECMQLFFDAVCTNKTLKYQWVIEHEDFKQFLNELLQRPFSSPETRDTLIKYWTEAMGENFIEL